MKISTLLIILTVTLSTTIGIGQVLEEKNLTHHSANDRYASYSPDGTQIIFESDRDGNWEIYVMDSGGERLQRLTENNASDRRPSWHPSGRKIIFESDRDGKTEIYEMDVKSGKVSKVKMTDLGGVPIFVQYSPDGSRITFSNQISDQEANIVIVNLKTMEADYLTRGPFRNYYPNWSDKNGSIVFFSRSETDNKDDEIYTIEPNGLNRKRLTNWPKHNFCPSWSSDGTKIAYVTSMENSRPEIYIMNSDMSDQIRITNNEDGETLPDWSIDDKKLLITAYRNGNYEIYELLLYLN